MADLKPIYNSSGQAMQVPSYDLAQYQGMGWKQGTPPDAAAYAKKTPAERKADLEAAGIDTNGLDESQVQWLSMMDQYQKTQAMNDKNIAPPTFNAKDVENWVAQAHRELGPAFEQAQKIDIADIQNAIGNYTGDQMYQAQNQMQQNEAARQQMAATLNDQGKTFSGLREQANDRLKSQQEGLFRSHAAQVTQDLRSKAADYQRTYGSQALTDLKIPGLSFAGVPVQPPTNPYQMMPGSGTAEAQQKVNEINRGYQIGGAMLGQENNALGNIKPQKLSNL